MSDTPDTTVSRLAAATPPPAVTPAPVEGVKADAPASTPLVPVGTDLPGTKGDATAALQAQVAAMAAQVAALLARTKAQDAELAAIKARAHGSHQVIMEHCNTCGNDVTDAEASFCKCGGLINSLALDNFGRPFIVKQVAGSRTPRASA